MTDRLPDAGSYTYEGQELDVFSAAQNWKAYFVANLRPYIRGNVAEIGAGLGTTTAVLAQAPHSSWLAVEPDRTLLARLKDKRQAGDLPRTVVPRFGSVADLASAELFDTILYIDVLEHIKDDRGELVRAARHLAPGGKIVVLSPAYNILFTAFDASIGHHRRYTLGALKGLRPVGLTFSAGFYLDSIGTLTSLANKLFLRQASPTLKQIAFWDRTIIPVSRVIDPLIGRAVGRSVIAVWDRA